jgi:hypothetical protein
MYPSADMSGSRTPGTAVGALLFLFFQALYGLTSSGNVFRVPDEFEVYFQVEHFVDAGDISVPQTMAISQRVVKDGQAVGQEPVFFGTIGRNRKPYAPYGPLVAFLALPHHLIGRAVASLAGVRRTPLPGGLAWLFVVGGFTMLATATAAALAVTGFHRAALAIGADQRDALRLSLLLGGATMLWPYGTSFFSEAFQAAAVIWAAALLLEKKTRSVAIAAALIASAGLTKVTSLVFAPAFVVAVLAAREVAASARIKAAVALCVAIAFAAGVHLTWNAVRFGDPLNFGYDWAETIPQLPARAFLASDIPRGLLVLLASPGKSLLLWAPPLVLSTLGIRQFWRMHRAVALGVVVAGTSGLIFFAAYLFPEGGYSHGPRNLVPILPALMLPAAAASLRPRWLITVCGVVGVVMALAAANVSYLDDQSIGADLGGGGRANYYERVTPLPGRAFNRYRLAYIPFVESVTSPDWWRSPIPGQGPDFFPLHLAQARRQLPNGSVIPVWLIGAIPIWWVTLLLGSAAALYKR